MDKPTKAKKQSVGGTVKGTSSTRVNRTPVNNAVPRVARLKQNAAGAEDAEPSLPTRHIAPKDNIADAAKPLNAKQLDFVREYLIDLHGTNAYMRAFPGVSAKSARTNASRLLATANIQDAIATEREKSASRLELTREAVLAQYQRLAFSDVRKFFDPFGQLKPISQLDDDTAAALQGFEVEMRMLDGPESPPVPVVKVKWADRKAALDSIMKAQGWNSAEKHEHTGKNGGAIETVTRVVLVPPKDKAEVSVRPISDSGTGD